MKTEFDNDNSANCKLKIIFRVNGELVNDTQKVLLKVRMMMMMMEYVRHESTGCT